MLVLKKKRIKIFVSIVNIKITTNNTIISFSDILGKIICWGSSGILGFKGTKKKTAFAAQKTARNVSLKAFEFGIKKIQIIFKGYGNNRDSILQGLKHTGLKIISIFDKKVFPHNGCRPPKKRWL